MPERRPSLLILALAPLCLGNSDCAQSLPPSGLEPVESPDSPAEPWGGAPETDLGDLTADCAPVQWLACGDVVSGDSASPDSGATSAIDFWPVSVGNYDGAEVAYAFRPGISGEARVRLRGAEPTTMNQDVFVLKGDRCAAEAAVARGFNSLDFEAEGRAVHFLVVDGFDGDAGPFELELECELGGESGPLPQTPEGCDSGEDVAATLESTLARYDVALDTSFPETPTLEQQSWDNEVCFADALDAALNSFLRDGADYEAPLALVADIDEGPCLQDDPSERVRCFMNQPGSRLDLVIPNGPHQPEHGEGLSSAWAFFLDLPVLSDHLYWAIVPRDGEREVYNYGFN